MKLICLMVFLSITSCIVKNEAVSDFEIKTGLSEDDFYLFMNDNYLHKLDTIDSSRALFVYAGNPIKIEFENGAPTELEPPAMDFLEATNQLDSNRLKGFKLIHPKIYLEARAALYKDNCGPFNRNIGNHMFFIHLPWYNSKDSTLLLRDVDNICPPYYHQGQGVLYRFKKKDNKWVLLSNYVTS